MTTETKYPYLDSLKRPRMKLSAAQRRRRAGVHATDPRLANDEETGSFLCSLFCVFLSASYTCYSCRHYILKAHCVWVSPKARRVDHLFDVLEQSTALRDESSIAHLERWCLGCCRTLDGLGDVIQATARFTPEPPIDIDDDSIPF